MSIRKELLRWIPPILSSGYHDQVGISVEIDAEYGGGFVTRPALSEDLAGSNVMLRLIDRARALVPASRGSETVDVHAVHLRGGASWTRLAVPTARATVAILIARRAASARFTPSPLTCSQPKLCRPFDTLAWTNAGHTPSPVDVIEGGFGDVLLVTFRG